MATGHVGIEEQFAAVTGVASCAGWRPCREVIDAEVLVEGLAQIREASRDRRAATRYVRLTTPR